MDSIAKDRAPRKRHFAKSCAFGPLLMGREQSRSRSEFGTAGHPKASNPEPRANHPAGALNLRHALYVGEHLHHAPIETEIAYRVGHLATFDRKEPVTGHPREGDRHRVDNVRIPDPRDEETPIHRGHQILHGSLPALQHEVASEGTDRVRHWEPMSGRFAALDRRGGPIVDGGARDAALDDRHRARRNPFGIERAAPVERVIRIVAKRDVLAGDLGSYPSRKKATALLDQERPEGNPAHVLNEIGYGRGLQDDRVVARLPRGGVSALER